MTLRVLVVDDHPFYREGVKSMAPLVDPGIEIVGDAGDGASAIAAVADLTPDVVLMDLAMPGMTGLDATKAILAQHPGTRVLVLTMMQDDSVVAALDAGASGYLLKDSSVEDVCRGIRSVARGELVVSPGATPALLARMRRAEDVRSTLPELSTREVDVARLLGAGHGNAAIARTLFLTPKTVRNYVSTVLTKLGADDREAAAETIRSRLGSSGEQFRTDV